ncbi:hypothetical protein C8Q70DRAFT_151124 [Cubamyces menziesii]|nr:hypothetical protein C8Q70DRAFT_151124 [Cubamyces menziesii]
MRSGSPTLITEARCAHGKAVADTDCDWTGASSLLCSPSLWLACWKGVLLLQVVAPPTPPLMEAAGRRTSRRFARALSGSVRPRVLVKRRSLSDVGFTCGRRASFLGRTYSAVPRTWSLSDNPNAIRLVRLDTCAVTRFSSTPSIPSPIHSLLILWSQS